MNEDSLYIHSFLMHKDIPFFRYCHAECTSRKDWQAALKHLNVKAVSVFTRLRSISSNCETEEKAFLLELSLTDKNTSDATCILGQEERDALDMLHSTDATLSPLSLVFVEGKNFYLSLPPELCGKQLLCFPCADAKESVVLSYEDFINRFIPEAHIRLL